MKLLKIFFIFFIQTIEILFSFAHSQKIELPPIRVEKDFYFEKENFIFETPQEILEYPSSLELRKRNDFGIAQDLFIRGANFEDNFIFLDGILFNHPQTGHFNLEIPLTEFDLEKIDIKETSLSLNFKIKKPEEEGFIFKNLWGEHQLIKNAFSLNYGFLDTKNRVSFSHLKSSGARENTDFEIYTFTFNSLIEEKNDFFFAYQEKSFGADSFYSSFYPFEEEHLRQIFFRLKSSIENLKNTVYFRYFKDKFILDRYNPSFYFNLHRTYTYGVHTLLKINEDFSLGYEIKRDRLKSSRLDKHSRLKNILFFEGKFKKNLFSLNPFLKVNYTPKYDLNYCAFLENNVNLNWFNLIFSFSRSFRYPSFTELYYSSPANKGNPALSPEKINSFETRIEKRLNSLLLKLSFFLRRHKDAIDWVKEKESFPWQAENVKKIKAKGASFYIKWGKKQKLILDYTYLDLSNSPFNYSKYLFDYCQHKLSQTILLFIKSWQIRFITQFCKPISRKKYWKVDLKVTKSLNKNLSFFIEGTNIFNEDYFTTGGIKANPSWFRVGFIYRF